jgi:hypothetical protein
MQKRPEVTQRRTDAAEMISEKLGYHYPLPRVGEHDRTVPEAIEVIAARAVRDQETRHAFSAPDKRNSQRSVPKYIYCIQVNT